MIRVVIADDHAIMREGLAMLMETRADIEVVGQACNCGYTATPMLAVVRSCSASMA